MNPKDALQGKRILIVDDHAMNIFALECALTSVVDVDVTSVRSGHEALDQLCNPEHGFDFVLMDMMMPVMNGYETTQKIREAEARTGSAVTIIAVTARAMQEDREKCLAAGVSDYVRKPVNLPDLLATMVRHCQS